MTSLQSKFYHLRHFDHYASALCSYGLLPIVIEKEQNVNIIFCALIYKTPSQTLQMTEGVYGEVLMEKTQVYKWHKQFHDG
jgi:hypothetical protein